MAGIFVLVAYQLLGECLAQALHLPVPGPVVGMLLCTVVLVVRGRHEDRSEGSLDAAAGWMIRVMGLLFVPAGAGVVAEFDRFRAAWLPMTFGLIGSTVLGLVATGAIMHWLTAAAEARPPAGARRPGSGSSVPPHDTLWP